MRYSLKNNKGFSLVELLVVLAIAAIVLTAISTFMIMNLKSFNLSRDEGELQSQGQRAMNQLMTSLIEAEKLIEIEGFKEAADGSKSDTAINLQSTGMNYVSKLVLQNVNTPNNLFIFVHQHDNTVDENNKLLWEVGNSMNAGSSSSSFIEALKIEPLPQSTTYEACKGLRVQLTLKKNGKRIQLENKVYFRNAK